MLWTHCCCYSLLRNSEGERISRVVIILATDNKSSSLVTSMSAWAFMALRSIGRSEGSLISGILSNEGITDELSDISRYEKSRRNHSILAVFSGNFLLTTILSSATTCLQSSIWQPDRIILVIALSETEPGKARAEITTLVSSATFILIYYDESA